MIIPLSKVNLFDLVDFSKSLSFAEKQEIENTLTSEIWYRIFEEKLPNIVDKNKLAQFKTKNSNFQDFDLMVKILLEEFPKLNINLLVDQTATEVKKDYVINYFLDLMKSMNKPSITKYCLSIIDQAHSLSLDTTLLKRDLEGLKTYVKN